MVYQKYGLTEWGIRNVENCILSLQKYWNTKYILCLQIHIQTKEYSARVVTYKKISTSLRS